MKLSGWGNYPIVEGEKHRFSDLESLKALISEFPELIAMGNARSYGDSALNKNVVNVKPYNLFQFFDEKTGLLKIQAGVMLSEILEAFLPRGWFLKVTPGTKLITVGGAIASDVHGKNHHVEGCFSEAVKSFHLMLASGEVVECSREKNTDLFRATCGGMGLTGIILDAEIFLKRVRSNQISQTTIKTRNLRETFNAFEDYRSSTYSVAWIDCLASKESLGRSLLTIGEFSESGPLDYDSKTALEIPFNFPQFALNRLSVSAFNGLYYNKVRSELSRQQVSVDSFFYPLDALSHWNRIYGKQGFTQYQFILPLESSFQGLEEILTEIADSGMGSFLAVLKLYGKENENFLSFPMEGYSLALDFKIQKGVFELLERLDQIVCRYKGRIYLAKDSRMNRTVFESGYSKVDAFRLLREEFNLKDKFKSLQSERLGL